LGIAAVFGLFAHTSFAQTEPAECAAAARSVSARAARSAEIEQLASCPNSGPDALKAVWQNAGPVAEPELAALVRSSRKTRDGRVYGAVTAIAGDAGKPTQVRLASLSVLAAYYRPDLAPSMGWLRSARVGDPPPSAPDAFTGTGSVPLPESRLADFPVLLSRLAHGDRDSSVAQAALRLRQYLALSDPDHTPVPPNAVRLVAGCRNLLSLQSTLDVTIPLHVRVVGTSTERTYTLKRWVSGPPVQLTLDLPPGQVAVTYGNGRELARLADRTGPCPANSRGR
jgi:hypothetical protein